MVSCVAKTPTRRCCLQSEQPQIELRNLEEEFGGPESAFD